MTPCPIAPYMSRRSCEHRPPVEREALSRATEEAIRRNVRSCALKMDFVSDGRLPHEQRRESELVTKAFDDLPCPPHSRSRPILIVVSGLGRRPHVESEERLREEQCLAQRLVSR